MKDAGPSNRRAVREKLCQVNWSPLFHSQSYDDQFLFFTDTSNEIIETSLPLRRVKTDSSDKLRVTPEIGTFIAKRQRAWSRGNDYNKNIADVQQSNPKQWWSAVKKIAGLSTPKMTKMLLYNDCTYQGEDLANLFNDKFVAVGSSLPPLNWCPLPVDVYPPKFIVSVEETETALLSSKLHSAVGPDEIPAWFLRENASVLCRTLRSIFNSSLRQGIVPSLWKSANVLPIPKSSPALNIDSDFCPISLTPILSEILESFPYR